MDIEERLEWLRHGFQSNAISGNPLTDEEKAFLENLVRQGLSADEISEAVKKKLGLL